MRFLTNKCHVCTKDISFGDEQVVGYVRCCDDCFAHEVVRYRARKQAAAEYASVTVYYNGLTHGTRCATVPLACDVIGCNNRLMHNITAHFRDRFNDDDLDTASGLVIYELGSETPCVVLVTEGEAPDVEPFDRITSFKDRVFFAFPHPVDYRYEPNTEQWLPDCQFENFNW